MIFPRNYFEVMIWININVCFPLTFLFIPLCFLVRLDHIPLSHYINLLTSNLIPIISLIVLPRYMGHYDIYDYYKNYPKSRCFSQYCFSGVVSVCFRMIFATERFYSLIRPQFHFMKTTKGFVTVSVLVWMFCIIVFCTLIYFNRYYTSIPFIILSAIMFIILLAFVIESLCVATSVPAEEKYRVVGTLVLLLVNYSVMILPMIVYFSNLLRSDVEIYFTFSLHYPLIDFFILTFMSKGPFIRLLMGLCCRKKNPVETDSSEPAV